MLSRLDGGVDAVTARLICEIRDTVDGPNNSIIVVLNRANRAVAGSRPEEVAEMAVFLLSGRACRITGAEIPLDGGHTAHGGTKSSVEAIDKR